jgi:hypothetical protein
MKRRPSRKTDWRDKVVAATGNRNDVAPTCTGFTQGAAYPADLSLKIAVIDEYIRPDSGDQLVFADHLTGPLHQRGQNVEAM